MKKYDLAALADAAGVPLPSLGRVLGLSGTTWKQARDKGVGERTADRYAVRLGLHPFVVWPEMAEALTVSCPECGATFVPSRKRHTYCTERCYQRQYKREAFRAKYRTDPSFREQRLAAAKRYRDGSKRALTMKQQEWKRRNAERQREYRRAYYLANRDRILAKQREYDARRRGNGSLDALRRSA